jgi:K+ potassium transporter
VSRLVAHSFRRSGNDRNNHRQPVDYHRGIFDARQAIQLGWLPRLRITQTSQKGYGQIYVGAINWLLMIVTVGLTLFFGKSDNLAAAYGIVSRRPCS